VQLLGSYQNNTEILLKAMEVIANWAKEGASNRAVLNYVGVLPPLLSTLHRHRTHEQLVMHTLRTIAIMVQEECSALQVGRIRGLTILRDISDSLLDLPWQHHVKEEVEQVLVQILKRVLGVPGSDALPNLSNLSCSLSAASHPRDETELEEGLRLQLVQVFEHALNKEGEDVLELLGLIASIAPPCWFTADAFKLVQQVLENRVTTHFSDDMRVWNLIKKFLEKALDGSAEVVDVPLAIKISTRSGLELLDKVLGQGIPPEPVSAVSDSSYPERCRSLM